jgi:hypothetical protein
MTTPFAMEPMLPARLNRFVEAYGGGMLSRV